MLLELTPALSQPPLPTPVAREDPLLVKHQLRLGDLLIGSVLVFGLLAPALLPGPAEELATPLGRLQLLGQLVAARVPVQLVLGSSVALCSARISLAICPKSRVASEFALPAIRVPSIAITSGFTNPASPHNRNTSPNNSASARSCRTTNRAIVA
jgi:hypothetical protein